MAVMVEVTVKTVIADNAANNMMTGYCKYSMVCKICYWQVQLTLYINWHHAVYFAVCRLIHLKSA